MRDLSVQASNSGSLNTTATASIQKEMGQLKQELTASPTPPRSTAPSSWTARSTAPSRWAPTPVRRSAWPSARVGKGMDSSGLGVAGVDVTAVAANAASPVRPPTPPGHGRCAGHHPLGCGGRLHLRHRHGRPDPTSTALSATRASPSTSARCSTPRPTPPTPRTSPSSTPLRRPRWVWPPVPPRSPRPRPVSSSPLRTFPRPARRSRRCRRTPRTVHAGQRRLGGHHGDRRRDHPGVVGSGRSGRDAEPVRAHHQQPQHHDREHDRVGVAASATPTWRRR